MTDRHEEEIDRVLRALGTAEPACGIEARILQQLNAGCPMIAEAKPKRSWGWALCVSGTLATLVLFAALLPNHRPTNQQQAHTVPTKPAALNSYPESASTRHPSSNNRLHANAPAVPTLEAKVEPTSRGLADLPSMLAPPEPTTQQEHLLVSIAHGPGPDEFALLNPAKQDLLAQQSAAEFKQFFPPQTPQEIYLATHVQN